MGIPLFCLEILFGQFASLGPIAIWEINPLFKGLGYTMVSLAAVISTYYNIVVATAIFFLFASMQETIPWTTCGNDWNTCYCRTAKMNTSLSDPLMWYNSTGLNCTGMEFNKSDIKGASEEYYYNYVLEATDGIFDSGKVKWDLTLCNLLAWIIICVSLIKGVKSMGKVWKQAASQIFFSLSCCTGSLTAMSSYNKFNNNVLRDSLIIPIINCLTSFYAGFAIFSVLGFMSENSGVAVEDVTTDGPGLVFVAYPEALAEMPVPQLWSVLFFLMMICLGMGTQFPSVETILTALQDEFPVLRRKKINFAFRIGVCVLGFLLGLPQTTQGGTYLLDLCDIFVGFPLLLVGVLEIVAIVWVYGYRRFSEDVLLMIGRDKLKTRKLFFFYYIWNWVVVTPLLILAIIIFECVKYEPIISDAYPEWAEALGWLIVAFIMIWTPLWYIARFLVELCRNNFKNGLQLFIDMNQPTLKWGPKEPENRTLPRYQRYLHQNTDKPYTDPESGFNHYPASEKPPPYPYPTTESGPKKGQDNPAFVTESSNHEMTKL